jgi:hypothetical protein
LVKGGAAGDLVVNGITTRDRLIRVETAAFNGSGECTAVTDVTDDFTIKEDGKINNDDETTTANLLVTVTYDEVPVEDGGTPQG